jgi:hypothetical protein
MEGSAMRSAVSLACLVLFVLALASCESDTDTVVPIPFENVEEADRFAVTLPGTAVFRDDAAWTTLWEQYWNVYDGQGQKTPPPRINFEREMVIAVFYGSGFSGCSNWIEVIEGVVKTPGQIEVRVGPLPVEDLGPCLAIVHPLQVAKVRRSSLPVVFTGEVPE